MEAFTGFDTSHRLIHDFAPPPNYPFPFLERVSERAAPIAFQLSLYFGRELQCAACPTTEREFRRVHALASSKPPEVCYAATLRFTVQQTAFGRRLNWKEVARLLVSLPSVDLDRGAPALLRLALTTGRRPILRGVDTFLVERTDIPPRHLDDRAITLFIDRLDARRAALSPAP